MSPLEEERERVSLLLPTSHRSRDGHDIIYIHINWRLSRLLYRKGSRGCSGVQNNILSKEGGEVTKWVSYGEKRGIYINIYHCLECLLEIVMDELSDLLCLFVIALIQARYMDI